VSPSGGVCPCAWTVLPAKATEDSAESVQTGAWVGGGPAESRQPDVIASKLTAQIDRMRVVADLADEADLASILKIVNPLAGGLSASRPSFATE